MIAFLALAAAAPPSAYPIDLQLLQQTGACIVSEAPREAREVLAMDFRSPAYKDRLKQLSAAHPRCLGFDSGFESSGSLFAGSLAEGLLAPAIKAGDLADRIKFDPAREPVNARDETEEMALCTVLYDPKDAVAVLATKPGTSEETAAMQPLAPVLGKCLKKGMQVQLNKPAVRAMLALAAQRILSAPDKAAAQ